MIQKINMSHPWVGARLGKQQCVFTVWAPFRKTVELLLHDRPSGIPMTKDSLGYWTATVDNVLSGAQYFYQLDGKKKLPDPASRAQPEGVHGPSAVVETDYEWTDNQWRGLSMKEMVMYELHVGTFTSSHDFEGVIGKLPYLKDLGVNAIELLPVSQFPGSRNWGYDGVFPFATQDSYGGAKAFKKLVNAAHESGIAVVLDVVYNHQGPEGNYLGEFGPYFTEKYKTGWGQAVNFDDAWCDGVRNFYWQNALMWLDEFHIDGLRLDAVHAIWDFSARHFIEELSAKTRTLEERSGRRKVLIAEFDLNNPRYVLPQEKGGLGLDGQWVDEFHHALHALITGEKDGYYEDFGDTDHLVRSLRASYVYTGQYSVHRKKHFGREPLGTTYDQFVVFIQNHDQTGNRMLGDRLGTLVSAEAMKLAAAAYLLSPHVPMLFMGEEYGEKNPFQYFISHTDKELVKLVREGRRKEFSYFNWKGEVPDPQAEDTFEKCMLSWSVDQDPEAKNLFDFYRHLIGLRKRPALQGTTRDALKVLSFEDRVICLSRHAANDYVLIVLNFNMQSKTYTLPVNFPMKKIFDSASSAWNGPGAKDNFTVAPKIPIDLFPQSAQIFEK